MHAQATSSRTTQKIRRPIEMEAIASIEDPTLRFFLEGEAMEKATRRAEAERAARERAQGFAGNFGNDNGETLIVRDTRDEQPLVPRRGHGGAIAFAALSSLTAIGVAAWMWMTPPVRPALWWLKGPAPTPALTETNTPPQPTQKVAEPIAAPKTETVAPATADIAAAPAVAAETATGVTTTGQAAGAPETVAAKAPAAPIIEQLPSPPPAATTVAEREPAERRPGRGDALRGYVWSPAAKAMVPSDGSPTTPTTENAPSVSAPSDSAIVSTEKKAAPSTATPTASPDSVMAPATLTGPGIAAPSTGPAPDETARVPTTEPAPFEPGEKTPAKTSAPIID